MTESPLLANNSGDGSRAIPPPTDASPKVEGGNRNPVHSPISTTTAAAGTALPHSKEHGFSNSSGGDISGKKIEPTLPSAREHFIQSLPLPKLPLETSSPLSCHSPLLHCSWKDAKYANIEGSGKAFMEHLKRGAFPYLTSMQRSAGSCSSPSLTAESFPCGVHSKAQETCFAVRTSVAEKALRRLQEENDRLKHEHIDFISVKNRLQGTIQRLKEELALMGSTILKQTATLRNSPLPPDRCTPRQLIQKKQERGMEELVPFSVEDYLRDRVRMLGQEEKQLKNVFSNLPTTTTASSSVGCVEPTAASLCSPMNTKNHRHNHSSRTPARNEGGMHNTMPHEDGGRPYPDGIDTDRGVGFGNNGLGVCGSRWRHYPNADRCDGEEGERKSTDSLSRETSGVKEWKCFGTTLDELVQEWRSIVQKRKNRMDEKRRRRQRRRREEEGGEKEDDDAGLSSLLPAGAISTPILSSSWSSSALLFGLPVSSPHGDKREELYQVSIRILYAELNQIYLGILRGRPHCQSPQDISSSSGGCGGHGPRWTRFCIRVVGPAGKTLLQTTPESVPLPIGHDRQEANLPSSRQEPQPHQGHWRKKKKGSRKEKGRETALSLRMYSPPSSALDCSTGYPMEDDTEVVLLATGQEDKVGEVRALRNTSWMLSFQLLGYSSPAAGSASSPVVGRGRKRGGDDPHDRERRKSHSRKRNEKEESASHEEGKWSVLGVSSVSVRACIASSISRVRAAYHRSAGDCRCRHRHSHPSSSLSPSPHHADKHEGCYPHHHHGGGGAPLSHWMVQTTTLHTLDPPLSTSWEESSCSCSSSCDGSANGSGLSAEGEGTEREDGDPIGFPSTAYSACKAVRHRCCQSARDAASLYFEVQAHPFVSLLDSFSKEENKKGKKRPSPHYHHYEGEDRSTLSLSSSSSTQEGEAEYELGEIEGDMKKREREETKKRKREVMEEEQNWSSSRTDGKECSSYEKPRDKGLTVSNRRRRGTASSSRTDTPCFSSSSPASTSSRSRITSTSSSCTSRSSSSAHVGGHHRRGHGREKPYHHQHPHCHHRQYWTPKWRASPSSRNHSSEESFGSESTSSSSSSCASAAPSDRLAISRPSVGASRKQRERRENSSCGVLADSATTMLSSSPPVTVLSPEAYRLPPHSSHRRRVLIELLYAELLPPSSFPLRYIQKWSGKEHEGRERCRRGKNCKSNDDLQPYVEVWEECHPVGSSTVSSCAPDSSIPTGDTVTPLSHQGEENTSTPPPPPPSSSRPLFQSAVATTTASSPNRTYCWRESPHTGCCSPPCPIAAAPSDDDKRRTTGCQKQKEKDVPPPPQKDRKEKVEGGAYFPLKSKAECREERERGFLHPRVGGAYFVYEMEHPSLESSSTTTTSLVFRVYDCLLRRKRGKGRGEHVRKDDPPLSPPLSLSPYSYHPYPHHRHRHHPYYYSGSQGPDLGTSCGVLLGELRLPAALLWSVSSDVEPFSSPSSSFPSMMRLNIFSSPTSPYQVFQEEEDKPKKGRRRAKGGYEARHKTQERGSSSQRGSGTHAHHGGGDKGGGGRQPIPHSIGSLIVSVSPLHAHMEDPLAGFSSLSAEGTAVVLTPTRMEDGEGVVKRNSSCVPPSCSPSITTPVTTITTTTPVSNSAASRTYSVDVALSTNSPLPSPFPLPLPSSGIPKVNGQLEQGGVDSTTIPISTLSTTTATTVLPCADPSASPSSFPSPSSRERKLHIYVKAGENLFTREDHLDALDDGDPRVLVWVDDHHVLTAHPVHQSGHPRWPPKLGMCQTGIRREQEIRFEVQDVTPYGEVILVGVGWISSTEVLDKLEGGQDRTPEEVLLPVVRNGIQHGVLQVEFSLGA